MRITVQNNKKIKFLQLILTLLSIGLVFGALIVKDLVSKTDTQKEEINRLNEILNTIEDVSKKEHPVITEDVLASIAKVESNNNPKAYNPITGASGKFQLTKIVYSDICGMSQHEAMDEIKNKHCAKLYMIYLYNKYNSLSRALSHYNAGYAGNKRYVEKVLLAMKKNK